MQEIQARASGTSTGVNIAPGSDDDGWIVPPPVLLADGTHVQLYKDGEALYAGHEAISRARSSIALEVYIFRSDATGWSFARTLIRRAREGLSVTVIYDVFGSLGSDPRMFAELRAAGVRLHAFHPWAPWRAKSLRSIVQRDHRKVLVVDGEIAVLGGQNLADEYGSSWVVGEPALDAWRDTGVGLRGPSVPLLAEAFRRQERYLEGGASIQDAAFIHSAASFDADPAVDLLQGERAGPEPSVFDRAGDTVTVLASVPTLGNKLWPELRKLLRDARSSIELTMAYFAPPDALVEQLCRSAREGVRVRLMLPGRSDVWLLRVAAHAFYERLLAAGVEVYERQHAVLHAKTLCVDGRLSIVGSTNLDYRSLQDNCELSVLVQSRTFGAHMRDLFEHDVRFARAIEPEVWRHRPRRDRLVQHAVLWLREWL